MKHDKKTTRGAVATAAVLLSGALLYAFALMYALTSGTAEAEDNAMEAPNQIVAQNVSAGEITARRIIVSDAIFAKKFVLIDNNSKVCGGIEANDGLPILWISGGPNKNYRIAMSITNEGPLVTLQKDESTKAIMSVLSSTPALVLTNPAGMASMLAAKSGPLLGLEKPAGMATLDASAQLSYVKKSND